MQSPDPQNWDEADKEYFEPLDEKYPDHPYKEQVAQFRAQIKEHADLMRAEEQAKHETPMSEAHWFYLRGLRLRQQGDEQGAQDVWRKLIASFRDVPSEKPWVRLAEQGLAHPEQSGDEKRWRSVYSALQRAKRLREEDKRAEADTIYEGLESLYRDDPSARDILAEIRGAREK
jgi:hypothetical protein